MPSRPVIRDSDDEQSVSPEKLPQIDLNPSDSFFDGIGGSGGVSERDNGVEELHTTAEGEAYPRKRFFIEVPEYSTMPLQQVLTLFRDL